MPKTTKKSSKTKVSATKSTAKPKREPTPAAVLKKVAAVSDSTKVLSKEIKTMTKIFGENQKVLVSMKNMIDSLTTALEHIQKQSKQINILEEDAQKLFSGLNQVRNQSNLVSKINDQTTKLQEQLTKINESQKATPKTEELSQQVEDSVNSIRNNSQMIIKIAQRIDEVRDDLRKISGKTESFLEVSKEIEELKNNIDSISGKTSKIDSVGGDISILKQDLAKISQRAESASALDSEMNSIKAEIDSISGKAEKIEALGGIIEGLKNQFVTIAAKADSLSNLGGKIDTIEDEINSLVKRADSTAFVGEGLKSVQEDISSFKQNVFDKTNGIDQKVSSLSELLKRTDTASAEFHKKTDKVLQELHGVRDVTNKASSDASKEMIALLKLSEYQSKIRMHSESKYGDIKDLESMIEQTVDIINLFDKLSIEAQQKIPLPYEVRQWAVSKILDCADKWEIRFSDVFTLLSNNLGRDLLKEAIRIQQIRDIYGIRAVDEIRKELNIS